MSLEDSNTKIIKAEHSLSFSILFVKLIRSFFKLKLSVQFKALLKSNFSALLKF